MPTILVVDDDESIRKLLEIALGEVGEVVTARDGEQALALAEQHLPDIVVMDVMMPDTSGLDVLRSWRAEPRTADLDVILLSARDQPADEAAGFDAGADAYVTKPMDVDVLQGLVATMLADRRAHKQAVLDEFRSLQAGDFPG